MSHKTEVLTLERLLDEGLELLLPQASSFTFHLESFTYLHLDGETQTSLNGRALQNFQRQYQAGQAPLFTPLMATLKFSSLQQRETPITLEFSPFGLLKPTYLGENPFKPYVLILLQHLTKKTIC